MTNLFPHKKIHVLGLGPVGLATTWELLSKGLNVHAYDISSQRIENILLYQYEFPDEAKNDIQKFLKDEKLKISSVKPEFLSKGNIFYICVGTPTIDTGIDLSQIHLALEVLIPELKPHDHLIFRSTLQPGCLDEIIKKFNLNQFLISLYPEFLREMHIIDDIKSPPLKISCHNNTQAKSEFQTIHSESKASINNFVDIEMTKVACNLFHALKVTFANEILRASKLQPFDAHFVMDQLKSDKKLNISELYLTPGHAFSGHCLEKDLTAFIQFSKLGSLKLPLINSILDSNNLHKNSKT